MFKKKGLLQSQAGGEAGEGVAYLKSWMWWIGMSMMIAGELCNFGGASVYLIPCCIIYLHHFVLEAYAFVEAILVVRLNRLLSTWHQPDCFYRRLSEPSRSSSAPLCLTFSSKNV